MLHLRCKLHRWTSALLPRGLQSILRMDAHDHQHLHSVAAGFGMMPFSPSEAGEIDKTGWPEIPTIDDAYFAALSAEETDGDEMVDVVDAKREQTLPTEHQPSPPHPHSGPPHQHHHHPYHHPHPHPPPHSPHPHPHLPKKKMHQIARILRELRAINQKVRSFEQGFISENGIKGREWYRHKGVAPGKWLGYGATTVST